MGGIEILTSPGIDLKSTLSRDVNASRDTEESLLGNSDGRPATKVCQGEGPGGRNRDDGDCGRRAQVEDEYCGQEHDLRIRQHMMRNPHPPSPQAKGAGLEAGLGYERGRKKKSWTGDDDGLSRHGTCRGLLQRSTLDLEVAEGGRERSSLGHVDRLQGFLSSNEWDVDKDKDDWRGRHGRSGLICQHGQDFTTQKEDKADAPEE